MINPALLFKRIGLKLISSIRRFPEALVFALGAVIIGIYLNHNSSLPQETSEIITRILMTLALGVPLTLCIKVLFERLPHIRPVIRISIFAAGIISLAAYYQFLLQDLKLVSIARYIGISLALYILFTFLPYFYRREHYELYTIKLLTEFIITYVYSLILYLGLAAIIFAIDKLFTANIQSELYFDIFLIVAGIFALGYFLSGIPGHDAELSSENYPKVLRVLLSGIVMPLTTAYAAILYAYFIKILITWNWPAGMVSNLVLWFSIVCAVVIFMIYIIKDRNRWLKLYVKFAPIFLLPLMAMMFTSIGIRIKAYGITENRYFVIVAGLWTTGYMLYLIIRRKPRNIVLAASLALIAILSVNGPLSSFSVSKFSQNLRFENILVHNGMLKDGEIVKPAVALKDKDKSDLEGILSYFSKNHSLKDVKYLPENFKLDQSENLFGFKVNEYDRENYTDTTYFSHYLSEESQMFEIKDYDYFLQIPYYKQTTVKSAQENLEFVFSSESKQLRILRDGKEIYAGKPEDFALKIHTANKGREALTAKEMSITDENSSISLLYVFKTINGSEDKLTGTSTIDVPEYYLFIKIR